MGGFCHQIHYRVQVGLLNPPVQFAVLFNPQSLSFLEALEESVSIQSRIEDMQRYSNPIWIIGEDSAGILSYKALDSHK